jgi:hypothetical protein
MGIEEEEVPTKGIYNIVNKIITENFPNLEKSCLLRYKKPPRHQTHLTKIEPPPWHINIKTTSIEKRERMLKAVKEKNQIT